MRELDLVIFDLAGTTIEDGGQVPAAITDALADHEIEVAAEQINAVRGSSKRQALYDLIPEGPGRRERAAAVYDSFVTRLKQAYASGNVKAVSGATATFKWLRERGVRIALNTGFDREVTFLLLDALHWSEGVADAIACGDDVPHGRPAPDLILRAMALAGVNQVERVANVGDTILDLRAAHAAGVRWNIGVLSGAHNQRTLETAPHTSLIASVATLPELLRRVMFDDRVVTL